MMSFLYRQTARLETTLMTIAIQMMAMAISPAGDPIVPVTAEAGCNKARASTRAVANARVFILDFFAHRKLVAGLPEVL